MSRPQDRLIHWLQDSLELRPPLFHLGRYCGAWTASTSDRADAGFHVVLAGDCWLHVPETAQAPRIPIQPFSEAPGASH